MIFSSVGSGAFAIAAALVRRARSGEGAFIDVSMLDSSLITMGWVVSNHLIAGVPPQRNGNDNFTAAPSGAFQTGDGLLNIAANKQEQFETLARLIGRADLVADERFAKRDGGRKPTAYQAGVYGGFLHYLKAVAALHSAKDGAAVVAKMKEMPTDDPLFGKGTIRVDGRKVHDMYLFEVKKPAESKGEWDLYKTLATIPGNEVFRPLNEGGCPLVKG
jgi:crotonobetainyl-CoA:carnitine CoA-transferase CaiB-like acyl-CoA transferase